MTLPVASLDERYTLEKGRVFLTGTQALVRLPMLQRQRDAAQGLDTACFISGYRGSPLGNYDQALWKARSFLQDNHIHFNPGVNEDLAATSVWGSQQTNLYKGARHDGVFALWYGKGPGVDRCLDVFKHANAAGTAPHGGVLALVGDDHAAASSTLPHQSEHDLMACMMPILHPANVQEYLDYGLLGWAMSRYSGCWIGFKAVTQTVESAASVRVDPTALQIALPTDFEMPPGGLNIRWPDDILGQEDRLQRHKVYAALAFARANRIDRVVIDSPKPRFGIITTGKSYLDVRQALEDLGIDDAKAAEIGLRVYKVGMVWPLERDGAREFAHGLEEVLVVEEKRAVIENQLKEQLYNWREDVRPRLVGKFDEQGKWLLPASGELSPAQIARVIAQRIHRFYDSAKMEERLAFIDAKERMLAGEPAPVERKPYFCSGCPHNTSTRVPEGSRAVAGIGCHFMALWMDRSTQTFTQMGGEGTPWIGQAPFTDEKHVFVNLGDGTYYHSGHLAIRASVAAGVNVTYKVLFNDAVAMTGGQPVEGKLSVPQITHLVYGEGVRRIAVVSDEPEKYPLGTDFAAGVTFHHRDELDAVQRELREVPGCSVLIYDQTCAAEKRRRRKRGTFPDPQKRVFINDLVCEGCGDCSVKSNCVSVEPLETEWGRKRQINQSSCNKDYSCVKGFCPSFVTVHGGKVRSAAMGGADEGASAEKAALLERMAHLPEPELMPLDRPYGLLITGIGGTGVVTVGQVVGMAAHIEERAVSVLDFTGLAQKNGAVLSHVRIAARDEDLHAVKIAAGGANVILGCDPVVAASEEAIGKIQSGITHAVVNSHMTPTAAFTLNNNMDFQSARVLRRIREAAGDNLTEFLEATRIATALMGDSIAANMFLLGHAFQRGLLPLPSAALLRAIELNGAAVQANKRAFAWGRLHALDPDAVESAIAPKAPKRPAAETAIATTLPEIRARREAFLTDYQDAAYAARYRALVDKVAAAEARARPGQTALTEAVARYAFKLMAIKDEYEVARLYTDGAFLKKLNNQFDGDFKLKFHLAPPLVAPRDPATGELQKREYGAWMLHAFRLMARMKGLRGGFWDIFGRTAERKAERRLREDYLAQMAEVADGLTAENHSAAVALASLPDEIRGFGHVRERNMKKAEADRARLAEAFRNPQEAARAAE